MCFQPRALNWVFTLNNFEASDIERIRQLPDVAFAVVGREVGASGTPHLQGYVSFTTRRQLNQLVALLPRAHFSVAKGSAEQNEKYCSKDGDVCIRIGEIKVAQQGKRSDLVRLREAIEGGERDPRVLRKTFTAALQYREAMQLLIDDNTPAPAPPNILLRIWQRDVIAMIKLPPADRIIHFYVDRNGNAGKSTFAKYIYAMFDEVQILKPVKHGDMAMLLNPRVKILILDCPRDKLEYLPYCFLEDVKDGLVTNTKFHCFQKWLGKVHVLVFMNEPPDERRLSADRFHVVDLVGRNLVDVVEPDAFARQRPITPPWAKDPCAVAAFVLCPDTPNSD